MLQRGTFSMHDFLPDQKRLRGPSLLDNNFAATGTDKSPSGKLAVRYDEDGDFIAAFDEDVEIVKDDDELNNDMMASSKRNSDNQGSAVPVKGLSPDPQDPPSPSDTGPPLVSTCAKCFKTFTGRYREHNIGRHMLTEHRYECGAPGCGEVFEIQDAMLKHYRKCHPHLDLSSQGSVSLFRPESGNSHRNLSPNVLHNANNRIQDHSLLKARPKLLVTDTISEDCSVEKKERQRAKFCALLGPAFRKSPGIYWFK